MVAGKYWQLTVEIPFQNSSFPKLSFFFYENLLLKCMTRFPPEQFFMLKIDAIFMQIMKEAFLKIYISYVDFIW